jgi:hypothetical protein
VVERNKKLYVNNKQENVVSVIKMLRSRMGFICQFLLSLLSETLNQKIKDIIPNALHIGLQKYIC